MVRRFTNREVREYFSDLGGEDWDPDITTARGSLRHGCTHIDADSLLITLLRCWLFDMVRGLHSNVPFYGVPVASFGEQRRFRPQIKLFFQEDLQDVEPGYTPVTGEIGIRLMDHDYDTITTALAQTYATRIRQSWAIGNGRIWRKGKLMASYTDWAKGYQLQILCRTEGEAREIIENVLDIQNDSPNWERMNISENAAAAAAYPTIPGNEIIYGKSRRRPRRRPIADVRFRSAFLHIWGMPQPIVLVDLSGQHRTALERVY